VAEEAIATGVEDATTGGGGGAAGSTNTVRVLVEVRPVESVATKSMVSVASWVVSRTMLLTSVPLRKYFRPRFLSALGPVMVAPRSW
jgi:hypothetical protein